MDLATLKYTEEHEWVQVEDGIATIGITQHACEELGEIVFVELPEVGAQFGQMDEFGSVESVKSVSSLYSPITGTISAVNTELESAPELISDSNYDNGWIIKIKVSEHSEVGDLLNQDEYNAYLENLD